jgi:hypothetical protein
MIKPCKGQEWQIPSTLLPSSCTEKEYTEFQRYEYVKTFEHANTLLPNTWIVVRIDGRGFHKSASSVSPFSKAPKPKKKKSEEQTANRSVYELPSMLMTPVLKRKAVRKV